MRVVLDTNVLVSGLKTRGGTCNRILRMLFHSLVSVCVDGRILQEYAEVLARPALRIRKEHVQALLETVRACAEFVPAAPLAVALPHPDDLPFLEVAAQAGAVLVTGNTRHFPRRACAGVTVVTPREFIELMGSGRTDS